MLILDVFIQFLDVQMQLNLIIMLTQTLMMEVVSLICMVVQTQPQLILIH